MKLSQISIYPIKSLTGIHLQQSDVTTFGLDNDRMLMLVDENGEFISQRKYPRMALLHTQQVEGDLLVSTPQQNSLLIQKRQFADAKIAVRVWQDDCSAHVADDAVNQWFSDFLGFAVRLVSYHLAHPRACDQRYAATDDVVSFADGFPLLLISESSLNDLNQRLATPVTMASFRPNLVISGSNAYAEDDWSQIRIGKVEFALVKPCSRCVLTTVDPESGVKRNDGEPLKTLSSYRRAPGGVMFGMNLVPRTLGTVRLGDPIEIIR